MVYIESEKEKISIKIVKTAATRIFISNNKNALARMEMVEVCIYQKRKECTNVSRTPFRKTMALLADSRSSHSVLHYI